MPGFVIFLALSRQIDANSSQEKFKKMAERLSHRGPLTEYSYELDSGTLYLGILGERKQFFRKSDQQNSIMEFILIDSATSFPCPVPLEIIGLLNPQGNPNNRESFTSQMYVAVGLTPEKEIQVFKSLDGVRPLYYAKMEYGLALSTEKKGIWAISEEVPIPLNPGVLLSITEGAVIAYERKMVYERIERKPTDGAAILKHLEKYVKTSFARLTGLNRCGVLFSGGVDSSLAALMANRVDEAKVSLISVAADGSRDFDKTKHAASALSIDHTLVRLDEETVWDILPEVIYAIETSNRMDVEIAIPFFLAARKAREEGIEVLVSGQGPDELFAGYARYERSLVENGVERLGEELWSDLSITHESNIARDEKAIVYHGVNAYFPYLDSNITSIALSTPIELLINPNNKPSRKIIFRELAFRLGVPDEIANAQKDATQYSSGSATMLRRAVINHVSGAASLSRRELQKLIQNVLHTIAIEIGMPFDQRIEHQPTIDMEPTLKLINRIGRLPTSNLR
ncbi:MAG: asparagine synthase C-terminal domain-containing protein [Promethearchaeota archaeon]